MKSLVLDGKKFVKASEAALEHGYTNDYIGQLCRANKVKAQLVGRTWYVSEESLQKHRKDRYRSSQKKTKDEVKKLLNDSNRENIPNALPKYYNRLVSSANIEYAPDNEADLIPVPKKIKVNSEDKTTNDTHELDVSTAVESEAEYYLDTAYEDIPKSGVLTIVEDETEAPVTANENTTSPVNVRLVEAKPKKPELKERKTDSKLQSVVRNNQPLSPRVESSQTQVQPKNLNYAPRLVAPLSVSLLAGLAVAMLLVGLSWQFQADDTGFSERYRLNMSSLMHQ